MAKVECQGLSIKSTAELVSAVRPFLPYDFRGDSK
jgi:hypothetical protein